MKLRIKTLWKVPVFCLIASWIGFYATVYLGRFFFVVEQMGADGIINLSTDPVRSAIFHWILFLAVLLIGSLWAFRSMTKAEIAVSAAIMCTIYLLIDLAQILNPGVLLPFGLAISYIQNWTSSPASLLYSLTDNLPVSAIISSFSPLLFTPFGRKTAA